MTILQFYYYFMSQCGVCLIPVPAECMICTVVVLVPQGLSIFDDYIKSLLTLFMQINEIVQYQQ